MRGGRRRHCNPTLNLNIGCETAGLEPLVDAYTAWKTDTEELDGAREMFQEAGDDVEIREMAREEVKALEASIEKREEELKVLPLPKSPTEVSIQCTGWLLGS